MQEFKYKFKNKKEKEREKERKKLWRSRIELAMGYLYQTSSWMGLACCVIETKYQ